MGLEQTPQNDPKPLRFHFEDSAQDAVDRKNLALQYNLNPDDLEKRKDGCWYYGDQYLRDKSHDGIQPDPDAQVWH